MIIIRLFGGLGNQLFQYALGRKLSLLRNTDLKLDITGFDQYRLRNYELNHFNIIQNFASSEEIEKFKGITSFSKVKNRILNFYKPYYRKTYVNEHFLRFDPNILNISKDAYLSGYWGSELYFKDIKSVILTEFTVKEELDPLNREMADNILGTESVSMHFRRGDYVTNPITNQFHGVCSLEYYHSAVEELCKDLSDLHFFIFSDDPEWVKQNFSIPYPVKFVTINGPDKPHEDLRLMSLCKHHIIANSTFSWWGAWLGTNPHNVVIAPKKWSNNPKIKTDTLYPDSWIQL